MARADDFAVDDADTEVELVDIGGCELAGFSSMTTKRLCSVLDARG